MDLKLDTDNLSSTLKSGLGFRKFSGDNYYRWRFFVKKLLIRSDLWLYVTDEENEQRLQKPSEASKVSEWLKKDSDAHLLICSAVAEDYLSYVTEASSAADAWDTL